MKTVALISDSTGDLGEHFLRALTSQFPKQTFDLRIFRFVADSHDLEKIFPSLRTDSTIVFHTALNPHFKNQVVERCQAERLPVFDLTGEAMSFLEKTSGVRAGKNPATLHELNDEYDRRISALNFTVEHDDGVGMSSWNEADIVLAGVSRTSKTPTSIYLANKGFKVANISLIKGIPMPFENLKRHRSKVVGLTIDPERLQAIRLRRVQTDRIPGSDYASLLFIKEELDEAMALFDELNCRVVNVTHRAVEEVAALVQKLFSSD